MLLNPGRFRAPLSSAADYTVLALTASLPSVFTYARNDTVATVRNASGKLLASVADAPRIDHTVAGMPLGMRIEGSRQNKITVYNASPVDTTGLTIASGTPVLSIVTDASALTAAGLDQTGNGNVFRIDNSGAGTTCDVDFDGTTGNTNPHSFSIWARETTGAIARLKRGGSGSNTVTIAGSSYARYKLENETPSSSTNKLRVQVNAGGIVYCILPQLEEAVFCSSEIITSGAAATRQRDDLTIASLDTKSFWNISQGYLLARYRPAGSNGADQYPLSVHDGSSSNTIGFRLKASDFSLQANVRAAGASKCSLDNATQHGAGIVTAAALTWKSGQSWMIGNGVPVSAAYSGDPAGIATLQCGARNGGSDPFFGHVEYVEIGRVFKTPQQLSARLKKPGDSIVIGGGQSLVRGHFVSQASSSQGGRRQVISSVQAVRAADAAIFVDGSTGSTAAAKTSNPSAYWWDNALSARGPAFDTFYQIVTNSGVRPGFILWAQGEEDSHHIPADTTRAQYKQALQAIFADMRASLGDIPVLIQRIGRRTSFANTGGVQAVREVQQELIDENAWCHEAAEVYDQGLFDSVHPDDAGYVAVAARDARKILSLTGAAVTGVDGPRISGATRSGTAVTVTIVHDAGTDFTPASGIDGFRFFDNASEIAITAAVRTNATTITLTLASTPSSGIETLYYIYDAALTLNTANTVRDNAAVIMPLRSGKIVLA